MFGPRLIALFLVLVAAPGASAQSAWQFRFKKDQSLTYRITHNTEVAEVVKGVKTESSSQLTIMKRWRVVEVDSQGTATLEQLLVAMKNRQTRPNKEVLLFDSENLDQSTPEMKGMVKFLNTPIAVVRVDGLGRIVEVKQGPKSKFAMELPFSLVLPGVAVKEGQAWLRPYTIVLDPPLGTGEKYQAEQRFTLEKVTLTQAGEKAIIKVMTNLKDPPEAAADRVPLLQRELEGQIVFDAGLGAVTEVDLGINRTLENHQGQGSSYRFASTYAERLVTEPGIVPTSGTK